MKRILFIIAVFLMAILTLLLNLQKSDVLVEQEPSIPVDAGTQIASVSRSALTEATPAVPDNPSGPGLNDAADAFRREHRITPDRATDALYAGMPRDLLLTMPPDKSFGERLGGMVTANGDDVVDGEWYYEKIIVRLKDNQVVSWRTNSSSRAETMRALEEFEKNRTDRTE